MLSFLKTVYLRTPIFIRVMQLSSIRQFIHFKDNSINLDVGCGDGWVSKKINHLLPNSASLYSVDWNKSEYLHIQDDNFIRADIHQLPFKSSSVDFILLSSVLQVVPDASRLLKEMYRIINDDGYMVITIPTGYPFIKRILNNKLCNKIINLIKKKKVSYQIFKDDTNKLYNISGKGFYSFEQIIGLLQDNGFKVIEYQKSPGVVGSFIFQCLILIRYTLGMRKLTSKLDLIFFPFLRLDSIFRSKSEGIELVLKLKKIVYSYQSGSFK
jgi:ubiquinone/menaquinone biosynthesis C-methylase UbiE